MEDPEDLEAAEQMEVEVMEPQRSRPETLERKVKRQERLRGTMARLRIEIGRLETEGRRRAMGRKSKPTLRARRRLKALYATCGRKHFSLKGLKTEREKRAALLKVKYKKLDRSIRKRSAQAAFAQQGTAFLTGERSGKPRRSRLMRS